MHYVESRNKIETFDLIGFRGSEVVSSVISYMQKKALPQLYSKQDHLPDITHVGLAIHGKDINPFTKDILKIFENQISDDEIYIFESTASGVLKDQVRDVFGNFHLGVQIRRLNDLKNGYPGKIYWSAKFYQVNNKHYKKLAKFITDMYYKPYETSVGVMCGSLFNCIKAHGTPDSFFCSELVVRCLQKTKILPITINPEKVVPLDFYIDPKNPYMTLDVHKAIPILYDNPVRLN